MGDAMNVVLGTAVPTLARHGDIAWPDQKHGKQAAAAAAATSEDPAVMRDDCVAADLVARARHGDQQAWDALVERYAPLVWSICRRYRLSRADIDDVGQTVWLLLVARLDTVRDPAALGGWIATTTCRECGKVRRAARPSPTVRWELDVGNIPDAGAESAESQLLAAERRAALRQAFTSLPPGGQQLLAMLLEDPPVPYAQISARLGIPVGSIGPTRRRCIEKLRRHPAIAALIDPEPGTTGSGQPGRTACAMAAAR
jgi:RNA polymerase sigma factor (sigma-70 family)